MAKMSLKGNEALAEAALAAGCRFYSGYPIGPQTEVLENLSWRMEEVGGVFIQAESELAAINMVLGASAAGARALTSTSGPGFSLKQEGISYLVAADLPAVIVDVMRIGNGVGDVDPGQGDYWQLTRGGGHGDYHTLVLAPAGVQECADLMAEAFDLAEKYRHPVLIASDGAIGKMIEEVEIPAFKEHDINTYDWSIKGCRKGDQPRKIQNVYYTHPDYEGYLRDKYARMQEDEQRYECLETADAEVVLVAYGISSRACREAVEIARAEGLRLGLIRPITLWPFPVNAFKEAQGTKAFLTVEMNILGQMMDDVKLATDGRYPVDHYGSIFEIPKAEGIIAKAKELLKKEDGAI